jgi:hypothetical protein
MMKASGHSWTHISGKVFQRGDFKTSSQRFFKPVVGIGFGVERLDLHVSGSPIKSDRFN